MTDFFTYLYPDEVSSKIKFFEKLKLYSLIRFIVRNIGNFILPIYFNFTKKKYKLDLDKSHNISNDLIVTLTTFPARIKNVNLVIETILRQTILPNRIVLWLSKDQFPDETYLPKKLLDLKERGLEIYLCEGDLRSYKKFYYTLKNYPNSDFIIIDDDTFYPTDTIDSLLKFHKIYPNAVCFNRGRIVRYDLNGNIMKYRYWNNLDNYTEPRFDIMATGVGGVYYPAGVLYKDVLKKDIFMSVCNMADDIWLYAMTIMNNTKLVKTDNRKLFLPIYNKGNTTLSSVNVGDSLNDLQIQSLSRFYTDNYKKSVFNR